MARNYSGCRTMGPLATMLRKRRTDFFLRVGTCSCVQMQKRDMLMLHDCFAPAMMLPDARWSLATPRRAANGFRKCSCEPRYALVLGTWQLPTGKTICCSKGQKIHRCRAAPHGCISRASALSQACHETCLDCRWSVAPTQSDPCALGMAMWQALAAGVLFAEVSGPCGVTARSVDTRGDTSRIVSEILHQAAPLPTCSSRYRHRGVIKQANHCGKTCETQARATEPLELQCFLWHSEANDSDLMDSLNAAFNKEVWTST